MLEDKLLIWKLKRGNKEALRLVYEKYKDSLRTIAGSMLQDRQAAEDVLHDVFVTFAQKGRQFKIRTSLKNYLVTSVVNCVHDEFRRRKRQLIEINKAEIQSLNSIDQLENKEMSQVLTDALAAIPYEQREVIVLHLKGGLKFKEIAKVQQTSLSTVHGRYKYGLKKMKIILNGELEK